VQVQSLLVDRRVLIVLEGEVVKSVVGPYAETSLVTASLEAAGSAPLRHVADKLVRTVSAGEPLAVVLNAVEVLYRLLLVIA
jgi:hypothetical protein